MKVFGYLLMTLALAQCASSPDEKPFSGKWKLLEMKCENGSETEAGKELREYYEKDNVSRTFIFKDSQMTTTIKQGRDSKAGILDCKILIERQVKWDGDIVSLHKGKMTKLSAEDKTCQGAKSLESGKTLNYKINGDAVTLFIEGPVTRINPKDSPILRKSGSFLSIYKRAK